jgi:A/G-specific adenine glycosylase
VGLTQPARPGTAGAAFTESVLAWGAPRLRDLPWRRTRDPWAILVSEVMLQQTQVPRVIPKYLAFLDAFPTPSTCATATLADVLRLWQGLGYPRRARNLHAAATAVVAAGAFPCTLHELLALPGVGPYTARAVLAFAFEAEAAVVDTNIARVYARVVGRRLTAREVQAVADAHAPVGEWWAWNQSIMELGATVCRPAPNCGECPVAGACAWLASGGHDPAIGSAGVSGTQARFDGSDRQARGALMKALAGAPVPRADVPAVVGRSPEVSARVLAGLIADGLVVATDTHLHLPS